MTNRYHAHFKTLARDEKDAIGRIFDRLYNGGLPDSINVEPFAADDPEVIEMSLRESFEYEDELNAHPTRIDLPPAGWDGDDDM